jgi:hypothetical protein
MFQHGRSRWLSDDLFLFNIPLFSNFYCENQREKNIKPSISSRGAGLFKSFTNWTVFLSLVFNVREMLKSPHSPGSRGFKWVVHYKNKLLRRISIIHHQTYEFLYEKGGLNWFAKVLKMTPPWNGSADIALTSEKQKRQPFWSAYSVQKGCF